MPDMYENNTTEEQTENLDEILENAALEDPELAKSLEAKPSGLSREELTKYGGEIDEKSVLEEQYAKEEPIELPAKKDTPVNDLLAEYKELKQKVDKMDMDNLSAEDRTDLNRYAEIKDFLDETRNSLDFVKASTFVLAEDDRKNMECYSLLDSKELYAELSAKLTNGFDEEFIKEVEKTRTERIEPEYMTKQAYLASINTPLRMEDIAETLEPMRHPYTVGDIGDAIDKAREEMSFNYIDRDQVIPSTLALYMAAQQQDCLELIAQEEINRPEVTPPKYIITYKDDEDKERSVRTNEWENTVRLSTALMLGSGVDVTITDTEENKSVTLEADKYKENYSLADRLEGYFPITKEDITDVDYENQHKPEKPVEIVESSDGYVMAASEVTPENEAEFDSKVDKTNNEVIHNEAPQETTIDPAAAGGKVKLEVVEDLGSKELKQIENGGGAYGNLADRYENSKYDETPDEPEEFEEEEEQTFGGYDDII